MSASGKVGERMIPNRPSPLGIEAGVELARLTETTHHPALMDRCNSCAFRAGTIPNGCAETVNAAIECLQTGETFYCHQIPNGAEPSKPCAGWLAWDANTTRSLSRASEE